MSVWDALATAACTTRHSGSTLASLPPQPTEHCVVALVAGGWGQRMEVNSGEGAHRGGR